MRPFGNRDRIGYMFGDLANDLIFVYMATYLMLFYTDIMGINGQAIGVMFLVVRLWDALCDVAIGAFIDTRKPSPKGKFRPYLIRFSVPIAVLGVLCFTYFPSMSEQMALVYAYLTYMAYGTLYSCVNIPYGSLASAITSNPLERTSLSTYRTLGAALANIVIAITVPKLIFDANNVPQAGGFLTAALIFAVLSVVFYYLSYKLTTERITVGNDEAPQVDWGETVRGMLRNRSLIAFVIVSIIMLTVNFLMASLNPYLFKDYFKNGELLSWMTLIVLPVTLVLLPTMKPLVARFGKKEVAAGALVLTFVSNLLLFSLPVVSPWVYLAFQFVSLIGLGYITMLTWALVADIIDYHEHLIGKRQEGTVYSVYSFARKLGQALSGGLAGFALGAIGYVQGLSEQTPEVADRIKQVITIVPAAGSLVMIVLLVAVYNLSKERVEKLRVELEAQRGH
ncbi:MFS transporter [Paenibacillus chartarius]|uniref:MFS transporter n=1 Tax=Paenibacillus chartarius TaxID=747481 RepID=A0ABV6DR61_9BACL